ncbi:hypothetical protein VZQ01_36470 [Myxococcus faecalis]|uniref:hypothetical protein n=1 Tax=Myxococcus faecalis TaxID=3115646 RepID=UPI003CF4B872
MQHQDLKIRLEYPAFGIGRQNDALDIWVEDASGSVSAIEVKYITHDLAALRNGESFRLVDQAATSQKRFDYLKDINRIESLLTGNPPLVGYALFLTNNPGYWNSNARSAKGDAFPHTFREGETLSGLLAWKPNTKKNTLGNRAESVTLTGRYTMNWRPYSTVQGTGYGEFRYVLVAVQSSH